MAPNSRHTASGLGLTMPSPSPSVTESDETSPHLNTAFPMASERMKSAHQTPEFPALVMAAMDAGDAPACRHAAIFPEPQLRGETASGPARGGSGGEGAEPEEARGPSGPLVGTGASAAYGAEAAESEEMHATIVSAASMSMEDAPSCLPPLNDFARPHPHPDTLTLPLRPGTGDPRDMPEEPPDTVARSGCGCGSGQSTPTAYMERRPPSSSIPHLLSSSNSSIVDAQQLSQRQLSSVGTERALAPAGVSHEPSFAIPHDGADDAAFRIAPATPLSVLVPHPYLVMNPRQGLPSPLEGGGSHMSSSAVSLASPSPNASLVHMNAQRIPHFATTPPLQVSSDLSSDQVILSMPPTSTISPENILPDPPHLAHASEAGTAVQTTTHAGAGPPLPSHQLPPPLQPSHPHHRHKRPMVQPVLYSAINSLERYNAGSFENKLMIAKARGTYGRCKAFPGVPKKKSAPVPPDNGGAEGAETSTGSGREATNTGKAGRKGQTFTSQDTALIEQVGVEQMVPITGQSSGGGLYKSKSSSNLDDEDRHGTPASLTALKAKRKDKGQRSVTIREQKHASRRGRRREKKVGVFRPSSDAYTPRMENRAIKYKPAEERASVDQMSSTLGTIQRPNFRDALRRVAIILHQHIVKIESRFGTGMRGVDDTGLFKASMREHFHEDNFATPRYKCSMVRVPMARPGVVYSMRKIQVVHATPTTDEIYEFAHQLFKKVQLSSECSIVCLIYVEKMMEVAKVPLVAETWRPIFMCGLLLASKVWQDLSSWNIEFSNVYPQYSLNAINRLELSFLKFIKWDLYISSSLYAKYYFALRSLLEKSGFRDRYNQMVGGIGGIAAGEALKISKRSEAVKEEALQQLSRSM